MQTTFTPISIPDKNTRKLRNVINPTSKKLKFSYFFSFYVPTKNLRKVGEKQSIMSMSILDREISPSGRNFTRDSASLVPGSNSDPSGEIKSILHMYCCGTRKSHPRTRIIRQKRGSAEFLTKLFRSEGGISLSHNNTS